VFYFQTKEVKCIFERIANDPPLPFFFLSCSQNIATRNIKYTPLRRQIVWK